MARRRREAAGESDATTTTEDAALKGPEPQVEMRMRGTAEAVKKQLGVSSGESGAQPEKPQANGQDDDKRKFVDALRNSRYIVRVKRITPKEVEGIKTNVEVWSTELPLGYQEIQEEITKECGGGKYRVAVVDPSSNNTIAADVFVVDGDPILPEDQISQEEQDRILMRQLPKSATEMTVEGLDRRASVTAKLLEVESLEAQLEDARKRRTSGTSVPQDDARINELDRRLLEAKHQAEIEARDRKHAEEMRELKALIAQQNQKPKQEESNGTMMMLMEQMREDRKQSQQQFTAILTQMKDDKLNAVLEEVKSIRNKPQQNNMLEMAETMLKLNKMISGVRDEDEEEDEDDPADDRPWWERAIDKLTGKFGDKFLDKLMEKFNGMEGKGEEVTREQFIKDLQNEAQRVADEAVAKASRQRLPGPAVNPALPGPPPPPALPAAAAPTLPPPPPAPAATPSAPPVATEIPPKLTMEQEILIRVGGVLEIFEREIELRPNEYHWTYEGCFNSLPESILEKVCAAPDAVAMLDAFAITHISTEKLAEMKAKISANPRMLAWANAGLEELKTWYAAKLQDPKFDPFAGEEGEEE